jgi:predicted metalloendopeptidase
MSQKDTNLSSEEIKIANLYNSYMDRDRINKLGYQPIVRDIQRIEEINDLKDLWAYFSYSVRSGSISSIHLLLYMMI